MRVYRNADLVDQFVKWLWSACYTFYRAMQRGTQLWNGLLPCLSRLGSTPQSLDFVSVSNDSVLVSVAILLLVNVELKNMLDRSRTFVC